MRTNTVNHSSRRLPSIDWIALGLAVVGLSLSRVPAPGWGSWAGLFGLAVFGPPLLRELGVLKDEDEYTRDIRWRAGFHAALVMALLVFLNKVLYPMIASHPDAMARKTLIFPVDYLRQCLVLVFLLSYLIQYWGPPKGVFRILLGVAGLSLIELLPVLSTLKDDHWMFALPILGIAAIAAGLAFLTRIKPRPGGYLLLFLGLVFTGVQFNIITTLPDDSQILAGLDMRLGMFRSAAMILFVFGATGISLLNADQEDIE